MALVAGAELVATCIACASCVAGMALAGTMCGLIGTSGEGIITTIISMEDTDGVGACTGRLGCICTAFGRCIATTKAIGGEFGHIGTCGVVIIITSDLAGSGAGIAELVVICIASESTDGGMDLVGTMCAPTGAYTDAIITITICMAARVGHGAHSAALASTDTDCVPCTGTIKAIGDECALIGICGVATITIADHVGSGAGTEGLADISIVFEFCDGGMVLAGTMSEHTGTCTAGIIITTTCMGDTSGRGVATSALAFICTACERSTATIRATGDECDHTGIFGVVTTTTSDPGGSGVIATNVSADTNTACGSTRDGRALIGTMCVRTGICIDAMHTITASMDAPSGLGVGSDASVSISTACERFTGMSRVIGDACGPTGICTGAITITSARVGSGVGSGRSVAISTVCESTNVGMVLDGTLCEHTGTSTAAIITTTTCMADIAGPGDATDVWECTCTGCELCTAITRVIGAEFDLTGICGEETIITRDHVGSGDVIAALVAICTACASFVDGMDLDGTMYAHTGTCTVVTITTTIFMDEHDGLGDDTAALAFTSIASEHCTGITRVIGAACVPTGTCGEEITTTSVLAGSGPTGTAKLVDTDTVCECTNASQARTGETFEVIGICIDATTTIITFTEDTDGLGAVTAALVCICTACEPCIEITKDIGERSALTGTCGEGTITTNDHVGSGGIPTGGLDATGTDFACTGAGTVRSGTMSGATGICGVETITTIISTAAPVGDGVDTGALVSTSIASERCTGTIRAIGVESGLTGICIDATTTTKGRGGSGVGTGALGGTSIACAS